MFFSFELRLSLLFALLSQVVIAQGTWTIKSPLPGTGRWTGVAFSIGTKGYLSTGYTGSNPLNDLWEWDQSTNTWTQLPNFSPISRLAAAGFSIGTKGYIGNGAMNTSGSLTNDWWEYDPSTNSWTQKANFSGGLRAYSEHFSIGGKGYVMGGLSYNPTIYYNDLWEYDPSLNNWTQKTSFPGGPRVEGMSFTWNGEGYSGMGKDLSGAYNDIWKYNPLSNSWTQVTNFPGISRIDPCAFVVCDKAILSTGWLGNQSAATKEVWQYDLNTGVWTQLPNYPGFADLDQANFSIGNKGYIVSGIFFSTVTTTQQLFEYSGGGGSATVNANPTVICSGQSTILTASGGGNYLWSTGETTSVINPSPTTSTTYTVTVTDSCGTATATVSVTVSQTDFSVVDSICQGDSLVVGSSVYYSSGNYLDSLVSSLGCDSILSTSLTVVIAPVVTGSGNQTVCAGQSVNLTAAGANTYIWSPANSLSSSTGANVVATPQQNTTYTVTGTNSTGCSATTTITVNILPAPAMDAGNGGMICIGDSTTINVNGTNVAFVWSPSNSLSCSTCASPTAFPTTTTTYTVTGTGMNGCTATAVVTVIVNLLPPVPIITQNGAVLATGNNSAYQWYLNGNPINGANGQFYTPTQNGFYQVMITDANGCTALSNPFNFLTFGLDEDLKTLESFILFPNPSSGLLNIHFSSGNKMELSYSIFSVAGNLVKEEKLEASTTLNVEELPNGNYWLLLRNKAGNWGLKQFTVQRK